MGEEQVNCGRCRARQKLSCRSDPGESLNSRVMLKKRNHCQELRGNNVLELNEEGDSGRGCLKSSMEMNVPRVASKIQVPIYT